MKIRNDIQVINGISDLTNFKVNYSFKETYWLSHTNMYLGLVSCLNRVTLLINDAPSCDLWGCELQPKTCRPSTAILSLIMMSRRSQNVNSVISVFWVTSEAGEKWQRPSEPNTSSVCHTDSSYTINDHLFIWVCLLNKLFHRAENTPTPQHKQ